VTPKGDLGFICVWEEGDTPRDPVEQLFIHMITHSLYDLARLSSFSGSDAKYRERTQHRHQLAARKWFAESNGAKGLTFRMACQAIGTDFETFQRKILGMTPDQLGVLVKRITAFNREEA